MYMIENYRDNIRFNVQFEEIRDFLRINADKGFNEHFHWGRFDWMMAHSYLDIELLSKNALFRDERGNLVGVILYDTCFDDRWYLLHSISDEKLLQLMIEHLEKCEADTITVKSNVNDTVLCRLLKNNGFAKQYAESVLEIDLSNNLYYRLPKGIRLNDQNDRIDKKQWRLVIHRGFDNKGTPELPSEEVIRAEKHLEISDYIKVFAINDEEYISHCGIWYDCGNTAYIEPVATVPEYRGKGLGRAVVYEALNRASVRGAKRAIVLSDQDFYKHIGMKKSSEVETWIKDGKKL
jgi:predicted N-acetyltransferase YhbS